MNPGLRFASLRLPLTLSNPRLGKCHFVFCLFFFEDEVDR